MTFQRPLEPTLTSRGLTLPLAGGPSGVHNELVRADQVLFQAKGKGKGKGKGIGKPASIGECL